MSESAEIELNLEDVKVSLAFSHALTSQSENIIEVINDSDARDRLVAKHIRILHQITADGEAVIDQFNPLEDRVTALSNLFGKDYGTGSLYSKTKRILLENREFKHLLNTLKQSALQDVCSKLMEITNDFNLMIEREEFNPALTLQKRIANCNTELNISLEALHETISEETIQDVCNKSIVIAETVVDVHNKAIIVADEVIDVRDRAIAFAETILNLETSVVTDPSRVIALRDEAMENADRVMTLRDKVNSISDKVEDLSEKVERIADAKNLSDLLPLLSIRSI